MYKFLSILFLSALLSVNAKSQTKLEVSYKAWYAPQGSAFKAANVQPDISIAYITGKGKIVGGVLTNHDASASSVYGGTAYNFIENGDAKWYGAASAGFDLSSEHLFFTQLQSGLSYSVSDLISLEGGYKLQWYTQQPVSSFALGITVKL